MRLLFWDLPFTCIGSLTELLGKPSASDRAGRATSVWVFSFNANSGGFAATGASFLLLARAAVQVQASEGQYPGSNVKFQLRALIHDQAHLCPPNWNTFLYVYSYPT